MPVNPHIVWICQWYPHEGDPYAGDFIQRHAQAVSLFLPITTYSCFADTTNKVETKQNGNLTEHIIYFKPLKTGIRIVDKALRLRHWYRVLKQHTEHYINTKGKPDLLHCHIILNTGWLGLWAKRKYNIPYLVSEHWSGFMPEAVKGFTAYNSWSKRMCAKILREATVVTGVSNALVKILQTIHYQDTYVRVPNVVNQQIFKLGETQRSGDIFRIIHISTFAPQKNLESMFAAFDALVAENVAIEFHIVGPQEKIAKNFTVRKFSPHYIFHAEMPQENLAALMRTCDVCVLYSKYETFGCVIIEANAVGLPVIVSDIPVLKEIVQEGINGVAAVLFSPDHLHTAIAEIMKGTYSFNATEISANALEKFAYKPVGNQFFELYNQIIASK